MLEKGVGRRWSSSCPGPQPQESFGGSEVSGVPESKSMQKPFL